MSRLPPFDGNIPYIFKPRRYQEDAWNYLAGGGKLATLLWHRRGGKDLMPYNYMIRDMCAKPGTYWHIFPSYSQGKKAIWEQFTKDDIDPITGEQKVGNKYLDFFPKEILDTRNGRSGINNQDLSVTLNPDLGGAMYKVIGAENPDSLLGGGINGAIFSEFDQMSIEVYYKVEPMLREKGGWALFNFTPHGRNHGFDHWNRVSALSQDEHFTQKLTVDDTCAETGMDIDELVKSCLNMGMTEAQIQQEYWCSFDAPIDGSVYASELQTMDENGSIGDYPVNYDLPVNTAWDWGMDDYTAIWFFQIVGDTVIFVDFYQANNKGMPHYAEMLRKKPYVYGEHHVPWDMNVRESNGLTRIENARQYDLRLSLGVRQNKADGVEAARALLRRCKMDKVKCLTGISSLRSYSRKYDKKTARFTEEFDHKFESHAADAFREASKVIKTIKREAFLHLPSNYLKGRRPRDILKI